MATRHGGTVNSGASALHLVLRDCNLLEYEPLLLEEGAWATSIDVATEAPKPARQWLLYHSVGGI